MWVDTIPPANRRQTTLTKLQAKPGKWYRVGQYKTRGTADSTAQRLKIKGKGRVQASVRKSLDADGERPFTVWARWVGKVS